MKLNFIDFLSDTKMIFNIYYENFCFHSFGFDLKVIKSFFEDYSKTY